MKVLFQGMMAGLSGGSESVVTEWHDVWMCHEMQERDERSASLHWACYYEHINQQPLWYFSFFDGSFKNTCHLFLSPNGELYWVLLAYRKQSYNQNDWTFPWCRWHISILVTIMLLPFWKTSVLAVVVIQRKSRDKYPEHRVQKWFDVEQKVHQNMKYYIELLLHTVAILSMIVVIKASNHSFIWGRLESGTEWMNEWVPCKVQMLDNEDERWIEIWVWALNSRSKTSSSWIKPNPWNHEIRCSKYPTITNEASIQAHHLNENDVSGVFMRTVMQFHEEQ